MKVKVLLDKLPDEIPPQKECGCPYSKLSCPYQAWGVKENGEEVQISLTKEMLESLIQKKKEAAGE